MLRNHPTPVLSLALSAACAACGSGDAGPGARPVTTRVDSAGVEIVVSEVPLGGAPAFAEVDPAPSLRIGSLDGAEEEQFGSIVDVAPLAEGVVAILDRQAAQVRLFDAEGAYLGALGSRGEGPGELMNPSNVTRLTGDTFAVYDGRSRRVTRYPAAGGDPDVRTLQGGGRSAPMVVDFFPDGRIVGATRWVNPERGFPSEGEYVFSQDSAVIGVYSAQGAFTDTAAVIADREILLKIMRAGQAINVLMTPTAFARSGVFAVHPEGVWAGFGDRWEMRLHDASTGSVRRILRAPGLERALTEDEMAEVHEAAMAEDSTAAQRERTAVWWELSPRPEIRPTYDRALVDDHARLWLREWSGADDAHQRWWVFKAEGDLLGYVDAPEGVILMAVSGDDAWGIQRDDFDVQYVVRYGLTTMGTVKGTP